MWTVGSQSHAPLNGEGNQLNVLTIAVDGLVFWIVLVETNLTFFLSEEPRECAATAILDSGVKRTNTSLPFWSLPSSLYGSHGEKMTYRHGEWMFPSSDPRPIQAEMVDAMTRVETALKPALADLDL